MDIVTVPQGMVVALIAFLVNLFTSFQSSVGPNSPLSLGWFHSTIANLSAKYPTPVTPAPYAFSIWGLIYLWTLAWLIYMLTTLCRRNSQGPTYLNPPVVTIPFLTIFCMNNAASICWLFLWDREYLTRSTVALLLIALTLYACLISSLSRVNQFLSELKSFAEPDLWCYRILIHNGLAIYAAWATVATTVNMSVAIIYDFGFPSDTATYVSLTILAADLIVFFIFDLWVIDRYTRYVFMVYPTFVWALSAIMVANGNETSSPAFIYAGVLVSLAFIFFIVKTVLMSIREPVYLLMKKAKLSSYSRMV
ncbi:uncharacterized protein [Diadema antillarum]|uniref:uncharacterized protein n=1 Tax=Diadema antillarum TaxID=105358 RepID=UPI003A8C4682